MLSQSRQVMYKFMLLVVAVCVYVGVGLLLCIWSVVHHRLTVTMLLLYLHYYCCCCVIPSTIAAIINITIATKHTKENLVYCLNSVSACRIYTQVAFQSRSQLRAV